MALADLEAEVLEVRLVLVSELDSTLADLAAALEVRLGLTSVSELFVLAVVFVVKLFFFRSFDKLSLACLSFSLLKSASLSAKIKSIVSKLKSAFFMGSTASKLAINCFISSSLLVYIVVLNKSNEAILSGILCKSDFALLKSLNELASDLLKSLDESAVVLLKVLFFCACSCFCSSVKS